MRRFEAPKTPGLDIKRTTSDMANFSKWNAKQDPRTELHDVLGLTGAEISINNLPAGVGVPFVHSHSPTTHGTPSTFVISYVGKVE